MNVLVCWLESQASAISGLVIDTLDADELAIEIEEQFPGREYQVERLGEPIMSGDGPWLVSQVLRSTTNDMPQFPGGFVANATFTVIDEDGVFKVARNVKVGFSVR